MCNDVPSAFLWAGAGAGLDVRARSELPQYPCYVQAGVSERRQTAADDADGECVCVCVCVAETCSRCITSTATRFSPQSASSRRQRQRAEAGPRLHTATQARLAGAQARRRRATQCSGLLVARRDSDQKAPPRCTSTPRPQRTPRTQRRRHQTHSLSIGISPQRSRSSSPLETSGGGGIRRACRTRGRRPRATQADQ